MAADTLTAPPAASARERAQPPAAGRRPRLPFEVRLTRMTVLGVLAMLLAVSVWLRTRGLHTFLWIDEGISVGIASHPLSHIPALMRQDGSPPLYYLILHAWMSWRGHSAAATHELSLVFALLSIPVAYWGGRRLFDRRTGLVCALLAAGVTYLNTYATETRMYALVVLLSIIVSVSFVEAFVHHRRRMVPVFALSLAAAIYTHNWALFLGLMCGVAFLWCVYTQPQERRRLLIDGALGFGAVALLYLPWLPTLVYQAGHTGAPWDLPPVIWSLSEGAYFLVGGRGAAMLLLLGGGAGLVTLRQFPRAQSGRLRLAGECLLILGVGTVLFAWAYSKITPAWADRYLAVIVGPLLLLFGLGIARAGRLGLVALALTACFWVLDPVHTSRDAKSNVAAVAAQIRPHLGVNPLVLSTQPEEVPTIAYYLPQLRRFATPLGAVADPQVVDWRNALERFRGSSVHGVLVPLLAGLRPGQRVVLWTPVRFPKIPEWMRLIIRSSDRWTTFFRHDPHMRRVAFSADQWWHAGVPVQATVYEYR